jgi:hypothetical protein
VSKIKNIRRTGWLVAGIIAALLLVPTTAMAVTAATTIIKGGTAAGEANVTTAHQLLTDGEIQGTSGNQADVTPDGQVLSTTASPSAYVNTGFVDASGGTVTPIASPPSGDALIVTTIHINTYADPTPGTGEYVLFQLMTGTTCTGSGVGSYLEFVNPGSVGEIDVPFSPGLAIPAGDALCALENASVQAEVSVTGYSVPSSEVTAGPLHRVPALPRQG